LLTVIGSLALGVAAGLGFGIFAQPAMEISIACSVLGEAEKAGYVGA
jgi:hypothetical protein